VIESDRACAEEDQSKSQRGCGQGELESVIARQPIVQVHLPDRDNEVHADGESRDPGKESRQNEEAAQELREGRNVAHPLGQTKTCHEFGVLMQAAENFVVAMHDHNRAESETHDKKRKGLQAFRVEQGASGSVTRLQQITAEKQRGVNRNQQNDCVAAKLLVTFFRPPSESCRPRESTSSGLRFGLRVTGRALGGKLSAPGLA
jgi:hypothetical protein